MVNSDLVDGVTKMRRMDFSSKREQNNANIRKVMTTMNKDIRSILIKLADRLHNMETLEYKKPEKQLSNAKETKNLYVPIADSIGAYQIKSRLADLSLKYIDPTFYEEIIGQRDEIAKVEKAYLREIKAKLEVLLKERNLPNEILIRTKNTYTIYNQLSKGYEMKNIYDLFYLKILVDEVDDCFRALRVVHENIPPINGRLKDYIYKPRTNHYRSLHTTGSDEKGRLIKTKIRTHDMDKVSAYGLTAYWNIDPNKPKGEFPLRMTIAETQEEVKKIPFAQKLKEIDDAFMDDDFFVKAVDHDLLSDHVYVYTNSGKIIELPKGSTALDFACQENPDLLDSITGIIVNGIKCPVNTVLNNDDTVQVDTTGTVNREDWENSVNTLKGQNKIKVLIDRQNHNQAL